MERATPDTTCVCVLFPLCFIALSCPNVNGISIISGLSMAFDHQFMGRKQT